MHAGSPSPPADPALAARRPDLDTVRILLVDDDPHVLALIELALGHAWFERVVDVATTVRAGAARIMADEHDVYLIDQQLPDGTGLDLIRTMRANGITRPFILMTGHGNATLDEEASRAGAADYVEKQWAAAQLERSIRYALRGWRSTRAAQERDEQVRQAQKMEALGRLAGGVAHDFNNLLTAIIGYTDLIAERLPPADATARDVLEIRHAAERAAALTRQLLAFSRKQFLDPAIIDLNDVAASLLQMLPRVIGDRIQITTAFDPALPRVTADVSQMEQVFVNLVLNARDAMPNGGRLIIETASVHLSAGRVAADGLSLEPGSYVRLSVVDSGIGMDTETRLRAFEPFFTTKPRGKGTGLGLSTVYGIVDQSGGAVVIDSALDRGTAVRIYLPATTAATDVSHDAAPASVTQTTGTETLLLVEDNESVRGLLARALRRRGYIVHEAHDVETAAAWFDTSRLDPDLLLVDLVLPDGSGPDLVRRLMAGRPGLRVLYMSGYADDSHATLDSYPGSVALLQKPFTPGALAERVRLVLDTIPRHA